MGQQAGVAAIPRLERKDVVANDVLQPLYAIFAGHPDFASMREIGNADGLSDSMMLRGRIAEVCRDLPAGDHFKRCPELGMLCVKA
jgi:hypothetical protein